MGVQGQNLGDVHPGDRGGGGSVDEHVEEEEGLVMCLCTFGA